MPCLLLFPNLRRTTLMNQSIRQVEQDLKPLINSFPSPPSCSHRLNIVYIRTNSHIVKPALKLLFTWNPYAHIENILQNEAAWAKRMSNNDVKRQVSNEFTPRALHPPFCKIGKHIIHSADTGITTTTPSAASPGRGPRAGIYVSRNGCPPKSS